MEFSREEDAHQNRRSRLRLLADTEAQKDARVLPAVCFSVDQATRSRLRIFYAEGWRFRREGISLIDRLLSNARSLSRPHTSQRHPHAERTRLRRRSTHARQLALISQRRFLRRQRSNLWTICR